MRPDGFKVGVRLSSRLRHTALVEQWHPPTCCLGLLFERVGQSEERWFKLWGQTAHMRKKMNWDSTSSISVYAWTACIFALNPLAENQIVWKDFITLMFSVYLSLLMLPFTTKHLSLSLPLLSHHNLSVDEVTECEQKKTAFHRDRERDPPVQEK